VTTQTVVGDKQTADHTSVKSTMLPKYVEYNGGLAYDRSICLSRNTHEKVPHSSVLFKYHINTFC